MSFTEPNVMRAMSPGGLASQRVPQRQRDPSLATVSRRLATDFMAFSHAIRRQLAALTPWLRSALGARRLPNELDLTLVSTLRIISGT